MTDQKRQVAYVVSIRDLLEGEYKVEQGWEPNRLILKNGENISRINLMATVISKNADVVIDDGTGSISIRIFDNTDKLANINIGDVIMIIGRPRIYGNEKYLFPEIIKKVDNPAWVEFRNLQLKSGKKIQEKQIIKEEIKADSTIEMEESDSDKIFNYIKDKKEGAKFEQLIRQFPSSEKTIDNMLKKGEIYEVKGTIYIL